jgi:colicin import membrane protein
MNHKVASTDYSDYFLSTMQSLLVHTVCIAFLLLTTDFLSGSAHTQVGKMIPKVEIVQAVTIDEAAVTAEVKRLEIVDQEHQQAVVNADAAKQEFQALKQKQERWAREEKQKLADLKLQAEKERDALKVLQQKKVSQEKELKALNERKLQEQERLKKVKEQQVAEQEKVAKIAKAAKDAKEAKERQAMLAARKNFIESERNKYAALIKQKVNESLILPGDYAHGLVCEIEIQLLPDGSVLSSKVVRSSGNFAFDRATEAAVSRASPLPMPEDKDLVSDFRHFKFTFDPSIV